MSYGVNQVQTYRRIAAYIAKIFNGAKAADLPVEQVSNFELVVNLKTARAIGVELPTAILLRADEVKTGHWVPTTHRFWPLAQNDWSLAFGS
jgi:putative tryptophan/tyrosine transport system substrate-binding protein